MPSCRRKIPVALRKESVDRNVSAHGVSGIGLVALRKESVDRNTDAQEAVHLKPVALRKESVDRNSWAARARVAQDCRSPQGERG